MTAGHPCGFQLARRLDLPTGRDGRGRRNQREIPTMKRNQSTPPSHDVYVVEGEGETAYWTRVGAAWSHEKGDGFNVRLSCIPVDGRLVIRKRKPRDQTDTREAGQ